MNIFPKYKGFFRLIRKNPYFMVSIQYKIPKNLYFSRFHQSTKQALFSYKTAVDILSQVPNSSPSLVYRVRDISLFFGFASGHVLYIYVVEEPSYTPLYTSSLERVRDFALFSLKRSHSSSVPLPDPLIVYLYTHTGKARVTHHFVVVLPVACPHHFVKNSHRVSRVDIGYTNCLGFILGKLLDSPACWDRSGQLFQIYTHRNLDDTKTKNF